MLGIAPLAVELAVGLVVVFLLEIVLFWAASALADVPAMSWPKLFLVVCLATVVSLALIGGVGFYWQDVLKAPLEPDNRQNATLALIVAVAATWLAPAVLYPILVSVSVPRGMWVSMLQMLLRGFLYVLIAALVMVALAGYQIWLGSEVRTQRDEPFHRISHPLDHTQAVES